MGPYSESFMKKLQDYSRRTVVVPRSGIKSDVEHAYNHWQRTRDKGTKTWPLPKILTFDEHIIRVWNSARNEAQLREYRLLDTHEFRHLWMKAGLEACEELLGNKTYDRDWITRYVSDICDESIRIWQVVNDYNICLKNSGNEAPDVSLQSCYAKWITKYKEKAGEKLISRAEIARDLRVKFESSESKHLFAKYERNTLFVILPSQEKDDQPDSLHQRDQYLKAAKKYGRNVEKIELEPAREIGTIENTNKFDDTNQEIQAAAAWAREILEPHKEDHDGDTDSHPPRIGVLGPNLDYNRRNAMERQFLATFCPDGYRVWETPLFKVDAQISIAQTPVGADALSYLRIRHAKRIKFSEAQALTRSPLVFKGDRAKIGPLTSTDQEIDSTLDLTLNDKPEESLDLDVWMTSFSCFLKKCSAHLESRWEKDFSPIIEEHRLILEKLGLSKSADSPADLTPADLIAVCRKFAEDENQTGPREAPHTIRLSLLEESVTRCEARRELDRLREMADYLAECAKAYESGSAKVKFNEAYEYFKSACEQESATRHPASCPVEILSFDQAIGRHFTHLWIMGMRDTDWPPPVRAIPFVDLHILREKAPDLFERDKFTKRKKEELQEIISLCGDSSNVICSFAKRDSGKDREYFGAGSMMEQEEEETGARQECFTGVKIDDPTITINWKNGSEERQTAFHPFYDNKEIKCTEQFNGHNANLEMSSGNEGCADTSESQGDEFATYFECPFKAFAVHRLEVERPPSRFGSRVAERSEEAKKVIEFLDSPNPDGESVSETWECVRKSENEPEKVDEGIYLLEIPAQISGVRTQRLRVLADLNIEMDGRCDTKNVKFKGRNTSENADKVFQLQCIEKDSSYEKFLGREKLYPLKVLYLALECTEESISPAYLTGQGLHSGTLFLPKPKGSRQDRKDISGLWDSEKEKVEVLINRMKDGYKKGILKPDPIGKSATSSDRIPEVCQDCHVRTACRHHYID